MFRETKTLTITNEFEMMVIGRRVKSRGRWLLFRQSDGLEVGRSLLHAVDVAVQSREVVEVVGRLAPGMVGRCTFFAPFLP